MQSRRVIYSPPFSRTAKQTGWSAAFQAGRTFSRSFRGRRRHYRLIRLLAHDGPRRRTVLDHAFPRVGVALRAIGRIGQAGLDRFRGNDSARGNHPNRQQSHYQFHAE